MIPSLLRLQRLTWRQHPTQLVQCLLIAAAIAPPTIGRRGCWNQGIVATGIVPTRMRLAPPVSVPPHPVCQCVGRDVMSAGLVTDPTVRGATMSVARGLRNAMGCSTDRIPTIFSNRQPHLSLGHSRRRFPTEVYGRIYHAMLGRQPRLMYAVLSASG